MKKTITLLLCLAMVCALSLTVLQGCTEDLGVATKIEIVDPLTEYVVGSEINYDELSAKITYDTGTTKEGTLKSLALSVKVKADLTNAGETFYTISYGSITTTVNITVVEAPALITSFERPTFYTNYLTASKDRGAYEAETRADFRKTGETYEVGNVNKFIFRPSAVALNDQNVAVNIKNVKTTAKVYEKETKNGEYKLLTDTDLEGIVEIEDNTYQFSSESAGKYYKVEVSIDEEEYNLSSLNESNKTMTFECVIIDGGYNVYDQMGLSVMSDLTSTRWQDLWKCSIDPNTFKITSNENSLKLEADDKPLCDYVGKIDWVILHASFELDADLLPDYYFWTENTEGYATAKDKLSGHEAQSMLVGSLRDGVGNGVWWDVINRGSNGTPLGYGINMQKGFYATTKVSVSGNYNGITTPTTASEGGRKFITVCDIEGKDVNNPAPHWQIFQMLQAQSEPSDQQFYLKNVALSGNMKQMDTSDYIPAGLNMFVSFGNVNLTNVVANGFYTNVLCDSYGATSLKADSCKLYDAYSNMIYLWRSKVNITNCEFVGAGGPLFILDDGTRYADDESRYCDFIVDEGSVLQAYATGSESWYKLYKAQTLVTYITSNFETGIFNNVHKTVRFTKDSNGNMVPYKDGASGLQYINVIAVICSPSQLFFGSNDGMLYTHGTYTTVQADGTVVEKFDLMNSYVQTLRATAENDGTQFAPIFQTGSNMMFTNGAGLYTLGATGAQQFNATDGVSWATDTHSKLAIYMSAGVLSKSKNAPYFGVILDCGSYGMSA